MSTLTVGPTKVAAFSGLGSNVNRRASACLPGQGPLPPRKYYIFDRQIAGVRATIGAALGFQAGWFALYAVDDKIDDDVTLCDKIVRGNFRLHPKGPRGISQGCVTVDEVSDFQRISRVLKSQERVAVPGSSFKAYGILTVA